MALVKCQRNSPNTPIEVELDGETEDDEALNKSERSECFFARKGTALVLTLKDAVPHANNERRLSTESLRSTNSTQSNNSDIQLHLQSMFNLLRNEETLKMAVKLESQRPNRTRYIVIASRCCFRPIIERKNKILRHNSMRTSTTAITMSTTGVTSSATSVNSTHRQLSMDSNSNNSNNNRSQQSQTNLNALATAAAVTAPPTANKSSMALSSSPTNRQNLKCDGGDFNSAGMDIKCCEEEGTEESCILGIDCNEHTTIGLVVPILADTTIRLDGDGGFSVSVYNKTYIFKPVSVQAMWSALQTLHKVSQKARANNFYPSGPSHDWLSFYESRIESDQSCLNEWNAMDSIESRRPPSPDAIRNKPTAKEETESVIKMKLKEIMMSVDLDEVTSKYIRGRLEEHLDMDLGEYKSFIDQEMLTILGQMDAPTEIFEHVYLGSEWNASNLEELQKNGVGHILNVTREIDNFFPGMFDYCNVRVYDDEKTNLLKHWDNTFRYITKAKAEGSKVLVHCKMGVSRSASVVIAYAMKAYNWEFQKALQHVKQKRSCIKPNKNFLNQLETYRGMLDAMKNKDKLQRSKSETNLKSTKDARLLPGSEPTPLIQALNQSKSKLSCAGVEHAASSIEMSTASGVNMKRGMGGGRNACITICASDTSMLNTEQQRARQRGVRRSSSTSPKGSSSHVAIVSKQQSQSLENLTPERSVADEPKNVRFPGSNGENYSVTQNRVLHIQKNTPPPPPPPPPPPQPSASTINMNVNKSSGNQQQLSSVRTIIHGLEGCERKTADDRKSLNLPFGRSISHDTSETSCAPVQAKIWQPATSKSNFDTITGSLRSSLRGFPNEAGNRSRRKTQSWAASSGGIVMDVKLGSNSSIDSASSTHSYGSSQTTRQTSFYDTLPTQRRELLPRHASWGSGDNRHHRHAYDSNRNATPMPIIEGRTHELNMSNKTANINVTNSTTNTFSSISPQHHHHQQKQQQEQQQVGTVSRTKQKLEENTQFKKRRQEIDGDIGGDGCQNILKSTTSVAKRNSNLYRSASTAANSARLRYPLRCNSDEIIAPHPSLTAAAIMRHSDATRPTPEFFTSTTTTEYTVSDIENKNLPIENIINDEIDTEASVKLRNLTTTAEEQQRISGNVQILKKSFEAKAGAPTITATAGQQQATTTITVSTNETHGKKGHQSLPSSPMAGQQGDLQHQEQQPPQQQSTTTTIEHETNKLKNVKPKTSTATTTSNSSSNTSASSSCSSTSVSESCDRNVKGLVYQYTKYQTTPTAATTTTSIDTTTNITNTATTTSTTTTTHTTIHNTIPTTTAASSSSSCSSSSSFLRPTRPRSYYEQNRRHEKFLTSTSTSTSSSLIGKTHEFSDSRPPIGPAKVQCQATMSENSSQQQQQQLQHRRLQQHGKTHPLARLSLQKHNINAAAYNTIFFRMFRTVSCSMENDNLKSKPTSNRGSYSD